MTIAVDPDEQDDAATTADEAPNVAACETCPGRVVFTEDGNTDGWISTDLTVALTR